MPLKLFGFPGFGRYFSVAAQQKKSQSSEQRFRKGQLSDSVCPCPSSFLPILVAFIFIFSISQLIVIHRTIETYKVRNEAYQAAFLQDATLPERRNPASLLSVADQAFLQNFLPIWPNNATGSSEWHCRQSYPYQLPQTHYSGVNEAGKSGQRSPICLPELPVNHPNLSTSAHKQHSVLLEDVQRANPRVASGGTYLPLNCEPRNRVLIVIPYSRDRWPHLKILLSVLHPMLQMQQLAYRIVVAEQTGASPLFNKGLVMNAAVLLSLNSTPAFNFDCLIFHDVDLVPLNYHNSYACSRTRPRHLSVAIDSLDNRLPYASLVGGALALTREHFLRVNGYSNLYWGWGGEDDDMSNRLITNRLQISRPSSKIARYTMLRHERRNRTPNQFTETLMRTSKIRFQFDGLTTAKFRYRPSPVQSELYTHFLIDVGQPAHLLSPTFSRGNATLAS